MWEKYVREKENPTIIQDEEYNKQSRITIYHPGDIAPYEIICGIYGVMFHTVFAKDIKEAVEKYGISRFTYYDVKKLRYPFYRECICE